MRNIYRHAYHNGAGMLKKLDLIARLAISKINGIFNKIKQINIKKEDKKIITICSIIFSFIILLQALFSIYDIPVITPMLVEESTSRIITSDFGDRNDIKITLDNFQPSYYLITIKYLKYKDPLILNDYFSIVYYNLPVDSEILYFETEDGELTVKNGQLVIKVKKGTFKDSSRFKVAYVERIIPNVELHEKIIYSGSNQSLMLIIKNNEEYKIENYWGFLTLQNLDYNFYKIYVKESNGKGIYIPVTTVIKKSKEENISIPFSIDIGSFEQLIIPLNIETGSPPTIIIFPPPIIKGFMSTYPFSGKTYTTEEWRNKSSTEMAGGLIHEARHNQVMTIINNTDDLHFLLLTDTKYVSKEIINDISKIDNEYFKTLIENEILAFDSEVQWYVAISYFNESQADDFLKLIYYDFLRTGKYWDIDRKNISNESSSQ